MQNGCKRDMERLWKGAQKRCSKDVEGMQKNLQGAEWVPKVHRMSVEGCLRGMERAWKPM